MSEIIAIMSMTRKHGRVRIRSIFESLMITSFLSDLFIAAVFPINIAGVIMFSVYSTIPKSAVGRWMINTTGSCGIAIVWAQLFQDPNSGSGAFVLSFVATTLAAFLEIALMTWFLRYKVGWDTPFQG